MIFKDNFSETLLVAEEKVLFYCDDPYLKQNIDFTMSLVTIKDTLINPYIQQVVYLFRLTPADIKDLFKLENKTSLWEILQMLDFNSSHSLIRTIEFYMSYVFGDNFSNADNKWTLRSIAIDQVLFERIVEITLIASGMKNFEDQTAFKVDKPKWLLEKEEEIARIKNQNKNKTTSASKYFEELMNVLVPLSYEFSYTFEELFNMNYFHIQFLSKYIPRIVGYDIQKRQVLSKKKIKYITEK